MIFRKEPAIPKSQMGSAIRRSELPHERQKANLAEPLASKSWWRRTDKNFTGFARNGVFQQNRRKPDFRGRRGFYEVIRARQTLGVRLGSRNSAPAWLVFSADRMVRSGHSPKTSSVDAVAIGKKCPGGSIVPRAPEFPRSA